MAKDYVEERGGGYFITDTRVSLDSIVYAFLRGESPEGIAESFPALTLEQIFGALTFFLSNRDTVNQYLRQGKDEFDVLRREARESNPRLYAKLLEARQKANRAGA